MVDNSFGRFGGFGVSFNVLFLVMFALIFIAVLGVIIFVIVRSVSAGRRNANSPRLTVNATVVAKRADISNTGRMTGVEESSAYGYTTTSSTLYFVTFEVESGDRIELSTLGSEYGILIEGDKGRLTFQGTRYISFERFREQI